MLKSTFSASLGSGGEVGSRGLLSHLAFSSLKRHYNYLDLFISFRFHKSKDRHGRGRNLEEKSMCK